MKKFLVVLLAVCLIFAFAACSTNEAPAEDGSDAADVVENDADTLVMATNAAFPPYEYYENNQIVGIDAEIAQAIADKLGMKLEIQDMEFGSIIAAVQTGKVDFGAAGMTKTAEREQSVSFTDTYATGIQVIIVKEDSPIASVDDLSAEGATYVVGVQQDTTGDIYCTDDFGDARVQRYNKGADAVLALTSGKVDCVIIDNEPAKSFVEANAGLKILETEYVTEEYAICVAKENTELLDSMNAALAELKADGSLDAIIGKYISAE